MEIDYEKLGEVPLADGSKEASQLYVTVKQSKEISPAGRIEFEKAKSFISIVSPKSNLSLYDHLIAILRKVIRAKIENSVDILEDLSLSIKREKTVEETELIEIVPSDEKLDEFIRSKKEFYKLASGDAFESEKDIKKEDEEEEESDDNGESDEEKQEEPAEKESEEELYDATVALPDLQYSMHRFELAGVGLSPNEIFELGIALKNLACDFKLQRLRFWGKIFAIACSYYIAEAPYQENVTLEEFGYEHVEEPKAEDEKGAEDEESPEEAEKEEDEAEEEEASGDEESEKNEETEKLNEPEERVLPPIPEPQRKVRKTIPEEENGKGVNEYMYFVCTKIGEQWRCLPHLKPIHIIQARATKRFFVGNLEAELSGCLPYPGKEAHYLRAQIARITAATCIAPKDYYALPSEDDDEGEDEEESDSKVIAKNEEYETKSIKEMIAEGLNAWVHSRPAILYQGRCSAMKPEDVAEEDGEKEEPDEGEGEEEDEDENEEEKEEPEILEAIKETEVPALRSISEDKGVGKLQPWIVNLSSKLATEMALLIVKSNLWPGSFTFYDGKQYENLYIGYGYKFSVYHYAPMLPVTTEVEYKAGSEILEPEDEEEPEPEPEEIEEEREDHTREDEEEDTKENAEDEEEPKEGDTKENAEDEEEPKEAEDEAQEEGEEKDN
ncbi:radial spoke head protein 6 homolog A-like [Stegodyphus dumicola]|uniref:radial spoke head protein 6 homolog A-like n=1 Tax=Stegodyphus dumicola TaxID=202533 RepID=UPI0015AD51F9|nr:radial spoke head protein 6 homolog A-like [Stegodyphus dumicola]